MRLRRSFWYYFSIAGMLFGVGTIIALSVTGEASFLIGKFVLVVIINAAWFIRQRGASVSSQEDGADKAKRED